MDFLPYRGTKHGITTFSLTMKYFVLKFVISGMGCVNSKIILFEYCIELSIYQFKDFLLVGCFGFSVPLRQYFSLHRAVSQKEERIKESKNVQTRVGRKTLRNCPSPAGPCPTIIQIVGRSDTGSLPRAIAPPDHPQFKDIIEISKDVNKDRRRLRMTVILLLKYILNN